MQRRFLPAIDGLERRRALSGADDGGAEYAMTHDDLDGSAMEDLLRDMIEAERDNPGSFQPTTDPIGPIPEGQPSLGEIAEEYFTELGEILEDAFAAAPEGSILNPPNGPGIGPIWSDDPFELGGPDPAPLPTFGDDLHEDLEGVQPPSLTPTGGWVPIEPTDSLAVEPVWLPDYEFFWP